ncbi:MAG: hypothetical protein R6X27_12970 [Candidatus Desulfacyla sp.]
MDVSESHDDFHRRTSWQAAFDDKSDGFRTWKTEFERGSLTVEPQKRDKKKRPAESRPERLKRKTVGDSG